MEQIFYQMQNRDNHCDCCIETDIIITLSTLMEKKAIAGFLQTMEPSSVKFVTTNPLGQPLFALVTKDRTFQSVNIPHYLYQKGRLDSFLLYNGVPLSLFSNNWLINLTGQLPQGNVEILEIRKDRKERGVWFNIRFDDGKKKVMNHLLIDIEQQRLLARMINTEKHGFDDDEETAAIIYYEDWKSDTTCPIPTTLQISEFAFGSEITLQLSNISSATKLNENDFTINSPPGFTHQILP